MSSKFPHRMREWMSDIISTKSKRRTYSSLLVLLLIMLFGYQNCSNGFQVLDGNTQLASKSADPSVATACMAGTSQNCTAYNGIGTQTCNPEGTGFGQCQLSSCNPAFNFQNGVCIPKACTPGTVTNCAANNGTGTQTCNAQGTGPGACMITACNEGYRLASSQCEKIPPTKYFLDDNFLVAGGSVQRVLYSLKDGVLKSRPVSENDLNATSKIEIASEVSSFSGQLGTACAVVNGALKCWGYNGGCKAGVDDGLFNQISTPTTVIPSGVSDVSVGVFHTCAIVNGGLQCFGSNRTGQLGNGEVSTSVDCKPKTVFSAGVSAVSASYTQTCAVVNGSAQCWGNSGPNFPEGQGTNVRSATPVTIIPNNIQKIYAGQWGPNQSTHACAIPSDGALTCFGNNYAGQIGNGKGGIAVGSIPPYTVFASGVTDVGAGALRTCAVVNTSLKCWGHATGWAFGITALQAPEFSAVPVTVIESGVSQLIYGIYTECAVIGKTLKCFGQDKAKPPTMYNLE